jgi:hypothetical protein
MLSRWTEVGKIFTKDQSHLPFLFLPVLFLMAVAYIVVGFGLWKLRNWARKILVAVSILYAVICGIVFPAFSHSPMLSRFDAFAFAMFLTMAVIFALLALYLMSSHVRMAFGVNRDSE